MNTKKWQELNWDFPDPYVINVTVKDSDTDGYNHVNNAVYLGWMDRCVWEHCDAVNMGPQQCLLLDRGFAAVKHEIYYLGSAYAGEEVLIGNWVTRNDGRLRSERQFQIVRSSDNQTLVRAKTDYVCTKLSSGQPARVPVEFKEAFSVSPDIQRIIDSKS